MVKIAERSSKSMQQTPRQESALTSAMTSDFWRCAPVVCLLCQMQCHLT
jgi:hypothetical protein